MIDTTQPAQLVDELEKNATTATTATAEAWRALLTETRPAVDAAIAGPDGRLYYRESRPCPADVIALWAYLSSRWTPAATLGDMLDLHARSIASNPGMSEWLRGHDAIGELASAAACDAMPADVRETAAAARARASAEAIAAYKTAIARQLIAAQDHPLAPAARAYLDALALGERVDAAVVRRAEHERAEAERAVAERREAEAQAAAQAAEQKLEVERQAAERAAAAEIEAKAVEAETAARLAELAAATEAEGRRIVAVAKVRHRLRHTTARAIRIGRASHRPADLAASIDSASIEHCTTLTAAIDEAERAAESRAS